MKKVYLDTLGTTGKTFIPTLTRVLQDDYRFIRSETKADYLFCDAFSKEYLSRSGIRVFCSGENVVPDFNLVDYGVAHDPISFGDRYLKYNYYLTVPNFNMITEMSKPGSRLRSDSAKSKTEFCSFTYRDGNDFAAAPEREAFFHLLSQYKRVDAGGKLLNNIGMPEGVPDKLAFDQTHKFSIAFENSSHPGYSTEKIVDAFAAGCIPIYWGDPEIASVFNEKAFINCHRYGSFAEAMDEVIRMDQDDEAWKRMLAEPPLNDWREKAKKEQELKLFFANIFEEEPGKARKRKTNSYTLEEETFLRSLRARTAGINTRAKAWQMRERTEIDFFRQNIQQQGFIRIYPGQLKAKGKKDPALSPEIYEKVNTDIREDDWILFQRPLSRTWDVNRIILAAGEYVIVRTETENLYEEVECDQIIGMAGKQKLQDFLISY